ncbi:MAG: cell envelope integrity protein CreD [Spirochaetaceae bacterium]|jgi:inner membrane protein|nr:cell envelope integrity protein CreD [Spirochaetaceae bacterium]
MNENKMINGFKKWGSSPMAKILITLFIAILLMIPISAIKDLMGEREFRRDDAKTDVINQWGGWQYIAGPILAVPVLEESLEHYTDRTETKILRHYLYILPDSLIIDGKIQSQIREKGIFEIELYSGKFSVQGSFSKPEDPLWNLDNGTILWEEARLILGLGDVKGLSQAVDLNWNGIKTNFQGGTSGTGIFPVGISAPTPFFSDDSIQFDLSASLKGGGSISFYPLGGETHVSIESDWVSPGFAGSFLPSDRDLNEKGFSARWEIQALARNYPQNWIDDEVSWDEINQSNFGVDFLTPVDGYFKSHRAIKYSFLFIFLPFITLFLFEIFAQGRLHPFQYIMVGLTVCMFFLLLLTLSEHLDFNLAYLSAGFASAALVSFYTGAVFRSFLKGGLMAILNAFLYLYLNMALASEDYALLIGSLGLFIILTGIMILTRKINWYEIGKK